MSIREVADLAGVSKTTVSRVLNNHPYVANEKRQAVLKAIQALHYVPNGNAVNLSKGKNYLIGIIIPQTFNSCFDQVVQGAVKTAALHGIRVMILPTFFKQEIEYQHYQLLKNKLVDGLIVTSRTVSVAYLEKLTDFGQLISTEKIISDKVPSIYPNRESIYRKVCHYLVEKDQYQQIVLTNIRPFSESHSFRQKVACFESLLPESHLIIFENISTYQDGYALGKKVFEAQSQPTAFYLNGDEIAAGVRQAAKEFKLIFKKDYELIGEDNLPYSEALDFSTIDFQLQKIGSGAVNFLLDEKTALISEEQACEFIVR